MSWLDNVDWSAGALKDDLAPEALASRRIYFSETPMARGGRIAFLFPGQGSQYPGMLSELAIHLSDVRTPFERATRVLGQRLPRPLASYVFPPPRFRAEDREADSAALMATAVAQPALGAAGIALYRLLGDCSVHPDMLAGHSYGEYVALCAAGAFDEDTLYALSEARGRCIAEGSEHEPGAMAGVGADPERTEAIVRRIDGVWIANINAPSQTIISGRRESIDAAIEHLEQAGIRSRRLPVACAFHSPLMNSAREQLGRIIERIELMAPRVPVFSNVSTEPYPADASAMTWLLTEQLVHPVRFSEQIRAMHDAGARVFVEVGPARVLSGLVDQILGAAPHVAVPMDVRERSGLFQLQQALGQLAVHGVPVKLDPLFAGRAVNQVDLDSPATIDREPAASTTWLLTGGRAVPLRSASSQAVVSSAAESPMNASGSLADTERLLAHARPFDAAQNKPLLKIPDLAAPPASGGADDAGHAVLQFQQLMASFLETQKQVMLAYLAANATGNAVEASRRSEAPTGSAVPETLPTPPVVHAPQSDARATQTQPANDEGAPDGDDVMRQLLAIVSERTGYPTELLGVDLKIEADLGIDSIKRVEIIGELGRRVLTSRGIGLHDVMAQLTSAKTLRAIADTARTLIDSARPASGALPDDRPIEPARRGDAIEPGEVPRFLLAVEDAPLPTQGRRVGSGDLIVITDDGRGIGEEVAASLRAEGAQVALLGSAVGDPDENGDARDVWDVSFADRGHRIGPGAARAACLRTPAPSAAEASGEPRGDRPPARTGRGAEPSPFDPHRRRRSERSRQ